MDETQTEETVPQGASTASDCEAVSEAAPLVSGMEINLGDFTRTQGLMKSLRLLLNNQIVISMDEIASGINEAGRKFKLGDIEQANQDVARLYSAFGQRTSQWESHARNLEQQMKMQAARKPKSISIDKMNQMKSEQTAVRTRIRTAEIQFRRLHQGLEQAFTNLKRQPAVVTSHDPSGFPPSFLAAFHVATVADRPEITKQYFEIDTVLTVRVSKGMNGGYDIRFDPVPPINRLYFLTQEAQVVRLQQLSSVVVVEDVETGVPRQMKLVDFVKQVQSGVWLLAPRLRTLQGEDGR